MGRRALVLSADEKVFGSLREALAPADCEICGCKEIFAAVEEITRGSFDLLLIDWQEELEADFLIKAARDLKAQRSVFAVAVVTSTQGRRALESGVDAILAKPFTPEQAQALLLPKLGVEPPPKAVAQPESESQKQSSPGLPKAEIPGTRDFIRFEAVKSPRAKVKDSGPAWTPLAASSRNYKAQPRRVRAFSTAAVVWPLIIAAALLGFDQWTNFRHTGWFQASGALTAAEGRFSALPKLNRDRATPAGDESDTQAGPRLGMSNDLLNDYASQSGPRSEASSKVLPTKKAEEIDLASVKALPWSTRHQAPVISVEFSPPRPVIPNSLRFPPTGQNVNAVVPTGHLSAPEWSPNPVALPESVSRGFLEQQIAPLYPTEALRAGMDGVVVLQVSIGRDGSIRDLKLVSGYLVLARAALDAVKQWHYRPYRRNGENVEVQTYITINFKRPPQG